MTTTVSPTRHSEVCMGLKVASLALVAAAALMPTLLQAQAAAPGYQAAEWARIVAAANKEGRVVIYYSTVTPVVERIKADFEKAYPGIVGNTSSRNCTASDNRR